MKITAEMLRGAFQQVQREILNDQTSPDRFQMRFHRMAEILNEKLGNQVGCDVSSMKGQEDMLERDRTSLTEVNPHTNLR